MSKGKVNKFNPRNRSSYQREVNKIPVRSGKREPLIVFSFKDFDRNQGESFNDRENNKLLALAIEKIHEVCNLSRLEATKQQIIKEYTQGQFPPHSDFTHPKHIPNDISWCTMHIQGKECVIGYFEDNIFFIVFLDKNHRFWITEKKHT